MRCFNVKYYHCVVRCLMLAGALSMPSSGMATEALPEGAASVATTLPAIVASPPTSPPSPRFPQGTVALSVSAEQWNALPQHSGEIQRSGETIVTLPGLLAVMQQVAQQPDSSVALHYPEDERGEIWVEELRDWLVALGLPSNRIYLIPGSNGDVINISQVAVMQGSMDGQNTPSAPPSVITEPFQIKEVTDAVNGVEIP